MKLKLNIPHKYYQIIFTPLHVPTENMTSTSLWILNYIIVNESFLCRKIIFSLNLLIIISLTLIRKLGYCCLILIQTSTQKHFLYNSFHTISTCIAVFLHLQMNIFHINSSKPRAWKIVTQQPKIIWKWSLTDKHLTDTNVTELEFHLLEKILVTKTCYYDQFLISLLKSYVTVLENEVLWKHQKRLVY